MHSKFSHWIRDMYLTMPTPKMCYSFDWRAGRQIEYCRVRLHTGKSFRCALQYKYVLFIKERLLEFDNRNVPETLRLIPLHS